MTIMIGNLAESADFYRRNTKLYPDFAEISPKNRFILLIWSKTGVDCSLVAKNILEQETMVHLD